MSDSPQLLLATRNPGKLREIRALLAPLGWRCVGLEQFPGLPEAPEDGATFAENARHKALDYARRSGCVALADDSGLEVDALDGAPGVRSARFAGPTRDDAANNRKLVELLRGTPAELRTARFRCAMALAAPAAVGPVVGPADPEETAPPRRPALPPSPLLRAEPTQRAAFTQEPRIVLETSGTLEGLILDEPRGENGFGYDPHFYLPQRGCTLAELSAQEKNRISHRGQALAAMIEKMRRAGQLA